MTLLNSTLFRRENHLHVLTRFHRRELIPAGQTGGMIIFDVRLYGKHEDLSAYRSMFRIRRNTGMHGVRLSSACPSDLL